MQSSHDVKSTFLDKLQFVVIRWCQVHCAAGNNATSFFFYRTSLKMYSSLSDHAALLKYRTFIHKLSFELNEANKIANNCRSIKFNERCRQVCFNLQDFFRAPMSMRIKVASMAFYTLQLLIGKDYKYDNIYLENTS